MCICGARARTMYFNEAQKINSNSNRMFLCIYCVCLMNVEISADVNK